MKKSIILTALISLIIWSGCSQTKKVKEEKTATIQEKIDLVNEKMKVIATDFDQVINLDHHRMAEADGVYTPPSIASIWSSASLNATLISNDRQLLGLDLPFKFLIYAETDTTDVKFSYTTTSFIAKRNGLPTSQLEVYDNFLADLVGQINAPNVVLALKKEINEGYGRIQLNSDFGFDQTVQNLKNIVLAQSDTKWFGEIDYQKDAAINDKELRPTTLLLFGGPAPGGKAMQSTPRIGLDAFCQKLLVYENESGQVIVAFNDIVAFSELYYDKSTPPQQMINKRLTDTFTKAISK